jgi:hypothetical protein
LFDTIESPVAKKATKASNEVRLGAGHLLVQVERVGREVDLVDRPRVLDGILVHLEEGRVGHRAKRQAHSRVENAGGPGGGAHWRASQLSGFSSEQATAAVSFFDSVGVSIVAFAMRVAGRDRR